jgi:TolB-like protein/class 3 adenylate cyclase
VSANTEQRKLAAIMFTDMVGYSTLAQRDDKLALELLEEHRQLLREIFPRFNGTEIKTIGDAFLIEFNSALEAAQCAIEIQRTLAKRNHDVTSDRRIELKIGIHIGDVVHRGGDVYGDGVNIASRIEPLAGAGGICVSMDVERQIRNALEARFEKLAPTELKNISVAMDLFRIVLPWERQQSEVRSQRSEVRKSSRRNLVAVAVAVALIAAALLGYGIWRSQVGTSLREVPKSKMGRLPAAAGSLPIPEKSIAVLPFDNLSGDKENEYFSDGISEELLTVLQKIPGLHVAARTSAFSFKDKKASAQEIGQKLEVASLVDGSVRKSGNTVRIAARLSRASTGEQLWSENYTRDLKDVFAVQSEIAQTIVAQLHAKLDGSVVAQQVQQAVRGGTKNPEAYEQFLQGRYYVNRFSVADFDKARAFLERACQLDPNFPLAWAALSQVWTLQTGWSDKLTRAQFSAGLARARETADRALQLDPDLPEALTARFSIQFLYDFDWKGGAETIGRAHALAPSDPVILISAAEVAVIFRDYGRAVDLAHQAVALDPVNAQVRVYLANAMLQARRPAESRAEYERVAELNPSTPWAFGGQGLAYLFDGKNADALTATERETSEFARLVVAAVALWNLDRKSESDAALATLIKDDGDVGAFQIAEVYSSRGDKDQAFAWLERARRQQDAGLAYFPNDPLLDPLRSDPRWVAFQRVMGWADDQLK